MNYKVVVVSEDELPLRDVTVEAIDVANWPTVTASAVTGIDGVVTFTGIDGYHFFRARHYRYGGTIGDRVYSGKVYVQVIGIYDGWMNVDYVVDTAGGGTHTTLEDAMAAAIATNADKTIWLCKSITLTDAVDIGGMDAAATITIASHSRDSVVITAATNKDILEQTSDGGNTTGGIRFYNVGLAVGSNNYAVYFCATTGEILNLEFEHCKFNMTASATGQYLARQTGNTNSLGGLLLDVRDCVGTLAGFYDVAGTNATLGPDRLIARNNTLTMQSFWDGGTQFACPDTTDVSGGFYSIATWVVIAPAGSVSEMAWSDLTILFSGSTALFASGQTALSMEDLSFQNIRVRFGNASGTFCVMNAANSAGTGHGLFFDNIYGYMASGVGAGGTFITVETGGWWTGVYVGNIYGKDFTTQYSGPGGVGPDHGLLGGLTDDDHTQYALLAGRAGGQTIVGGTAADEALILQSTAHATKGSVILGSASEFELDEATGQLLLPTQGSGAGILIGGDVQLYRSAANVWETPDSLIVDTAFNAGTYGYIGGTGAPNATSTGDLTVGSYLTVGTNSAPSATGKTMRVYNTLTDTAAGSVAHMTVQPTLSPVSNSSTEFRTIYLQEILSPATGITLNAVRGLYLEVRDRSDAAVAEIVGGLLAPVVIDSSSPAAVGTVTLASGLKYYPVVRPSGTSTVTVTTARGFDAAFDTMTNTADITIGTLTGFYISNPPASPAITNLIGIDIEALTRGVTLNIGIRNAATLLQSGTSQFTGAIDIDAQVNLSAELVLDAASSLSTISKYRNAAGDQIIDFDIDNLQAGEDARIRVFRSTTAAGADDRFTIYSPGTSTANFDFLANSGRFNMAAQGSGGGILMGGDTQLYRSAAGIMSIATGDVFNSIDHGGITVASDQVYGGKMIRKTADETVTSSATLQNDDELVFAVDANEEWVFTLVVYYSSTSNAGFKFNFTLPTGAVGWKSVDGTGVAIGAQSITTERDAALDVGSVYVMHCAVEVGANAGNVQFQWCQSTSHADSTTVKEHSWLRAHRVA